MATLKKPTDFKSSLTFLRIIADDIYTYTSKDLPRDVYWMNCYKLFWQSLDTIQTQFDLEKRDRNITKETKSELANTMNSIKSSFDSIYRIEYDEITEDFLYEEEGTVKCRDGWLRIFNDLKINIEGKNDRNEGFVVSGKKVSGFYSNELPISILYESSLYLKKKYKAKEYNFQFSLVSAIYYCIYYSAISFISNPKEEMTNLEKIKSIADDMFPENISNESKTFKMIRDAKKKINPLLNEGKDLLDELSKTIKDQLEGINDDEMDNLADEAQKKLLFVHKQSGNIMSLINDMMGTTDTAKIDQTLIEKGIDIKSIQNTLYSDMSLSDDILDELQNSIPSIPSVSK